jgi:cytidylate kinase
MSLITISRGSYSKGKEVAEKVAKKLGYECIGRETIIEASKEFDVPENNLIRAIHKSPSLLEKFTYEKERYLTYLQVALLRQFQKDNVVYHGLAGHFFINGVSHNFKVRITVDMETRIKHQMEREGVSREIAERMLKHDDDERRKWSRYLYGIDTWDSSLYDLVLHLTNKADLAVDIICQMAKSEQYQTTPESQKALNDLLTVATVKAALIDIKPDVVVNARNGTIDVKTKAPLIQEKLLVQKVEEATKGLAIGKAIRVNVHPVLPY